MVPYMEDDNLVLHNRKDIVFHRESSTTGTDYPLKLSMHQTYYHSKLN